jgi:hypothetical protein
MELRIILSKLIYNFDIEMKTKDYDWKEQGTFVMWDKRPLLVSLQQAKR